MRIVVRLVSALLGVAAAGAGVILGVEVAWAHWNPGHGGLIVPWRHWRRAVGGLVWSDVPVQVTASLVALAGLLLMLVAAGARRHDVRMYDPAPDVSVVTSSRSLARAVGHRVRGQDGVGEASVRASPRRVKIRATTRFAPAYELRARLTETAEDALDALPVPRTPRVSVVVRSRLATPMPPTAETSRAAPDETAGTTPEETG